MAALALLALPAPAAALDLSETDVEAIGRVVYAEAAGEPAAGKVAVIDTILNRLGSGRFGSSVQSIVDQPNAFEPVTRAGGWRQLPPLTATQRAELATILSLKAGGYLGDISSGALYFQNAAIVAERVATGKVAPSLVHFGGMPKTAVIGHHTFYRPDDPAGGPPPGTTTPARRTLRSSFVGDDPALAPAPPETGEGETVLVLSLTFRLQRLRRRDETAWSSSWLGYRPSGLDRRCPGFG
ncbi:cell wall hydrolase (plasmid) [Defluviicoccus vanus]|uniref:Cell wall hydrolase n=1 Tax=Defluviicoccus vanus TaxID=111831 RepID=A0A7H1N6X7_9PROT|nr:cell wall hydrolase [Defluviicoccus vanus]